MLFDVIETINIIEVQVNGRVFDVLQVNRRNVIEVHEIVFNG